MLSFLKSLFSKTDYKRLLQDGAIIVDVRHAHEFDGGSIPKSKNIPLDKLKLHIDKLKAQNVPIICCCMSGVRSGMAAGTLKSHGIKAYNGGGWRSLLRKIS
jgi:phage shock protein E